MAPPLQKHLQISFALDTGSGGIDLVDLPIRPEELTRVDPFRVTAMNTLDGAWVDAFGRGLSQLTISGHTGWGQGNRPNGIEQFMKLRDMVHAWGTARSASAAMGVDPASVRLMFVDALNGNTLSDVVPTQFTLKRSKSQPLLIYYNISMIVIADGSAGAAGGVSGNTNTAIMSAASISGSIGAVQSIQSIGSGVVASMGSFAAQVSALTNSVIMPVVGVASGVIQAANMARQVISTPAQMAVGLAAELSAAGSRLWGAAASVASLPAYAASIPMQVQSALSNISTNLSIGFASLPSLQSYGGIYGASSMSDVSGGRPASVYAGSNTFAGITPTSAPLVVATRQALLAIQSLRSLDVTQPVSPSQLLGLAAQIQSGVRVA